MFYIFFALLAAIAIFIIWNTWSRYTRYSNGNYKNGGQDIVLWCPKSKDDIINSLNKKENKDTLRYDFFQDNGTYYIKVRGIRRWQKESLFKAIFRVDMITGEDGTYIVAKRTQMIYSCAFEAELYEFFVKKLDCVAKKEILNW